MSISLKNGKVIKVYRRYVFLCHPVYSSVFGRVIRVLAMHAIGFIIHQELYYNILIIILIVLFIELRRLCIGAASFFFDDNLKGVNMESIDILQFLTEYQWTLLFSLTRLDKNKSI